MCSFLEPAWRTARRTGREETLSIARNAPGGRAARTRSAISQRRARAPKVPSSARRYGRESHGARARVGSGLRRYRILAAQSFRHLVCARAAGLFRRPQRISKMSKESTGTGPFPGQRDRDIALPTHGRRIPALDLAPDQPDNRASADTHTKGTSSSRTETSEQTEPPCDVDRPLRPPGSIGWPETE